MKKLLLPISVWLNVFFTAAFIYMYMSSKIETRYAAQYSEDNFSKVDCTYTKQQVLEILGVPLSIKCFEPNNQTKVTQTTGLDVDSVRKICDNSTENELWFYSAGESMNSNYNSRVIWFQKSDQVLKISSNTWYD